MRKFFVTVLALTLAGCSAFQPVPASQPTAVPPTAQVIVETVVVTVIPTQPPTQTYTPTEPASPTVPPIMLTLGAVTPTSEGAAAPSVTPEAGGVTVPTSLLGGVFESITLSVDRISLRCEPKIIHFDLRTSNPHITLVEFYYRVRGKTASDTPDWSRGDTLDSDKVNHFWLDYSASDVVPDNRKADGWFELEFVGVNNLGDVVGRTEAITKLVTYTINCP